MFLALNMHLKLPACR